jgi:hypothetical protein
MTVPRRQVPHRLVAIDADTMEGVESDETARRILGALAAEPSAVLFRPSERGRQVLTSLSEDIPVVAVLPDLPKLMRDAAERGAVQAALGRVAGTGIRTWWRLAMTGLRHAGRVARQDLEGLLPVLIELERAALAGKQLRGIALAAPLTDLLLTAGHRDCLAHVVAFLRDQVGTLAGFETLNLGHLLTRLDAWGVTPDFVIGPLNPRGFRMKPSQQAVRAAVRASPIPVLASEVTAGGTVLLADGTAHARECGAAGVVLTLRDIAGEPSQGES